MLVQTNTYYVPPDKRDHHQRLMRHFRQTLHRLGCDRFAVYEQTDADFAPSSTPGRFVQVMRFRDRRHHQTVQEAERRDPTARDLIRQFCELIDFPSQQAQGLFAVNYYTLLPDSSSEPPQG